MKRTGRFTRNMALLLALLLALFLLAACQPTPEKDIIINKGDGALVPAWLAFYQQRMGSAEPLTAFIAVNAVDGSTIDLKVRFGG